MNGFKIRLFNYFEMRVEKVEMVEKVEFCDKQIFYILNSKAVFNLNTSCFKKINSKAVLRI